MALQDVVVPDIGNYNDVPVIELNVKVGDSIKPEQSLITLETDKATMDIPAPFEGLVKAIKVKVGDKVSQGALILQVEALTAEVVPAAKSAASDKLSSAPEATTNKMPPPEAPVAVSTAAVATNTQNSDYVHAGPAVRQLARELGLDLTKIMGSGPKNRITREDLTQLVKKTLQNAGPKGGAGFDLPADPQVDFAQFGAIKTEPLPRIKKLSGGFLARNWVRIPHITLFDEADISDLEAFRNAKKAAAEKSGAKLTPLPFLLKAVAAALKQYPLVNSSLSSDGQSLVFKEYIHIGVAVDTPDGLMVPVIRNVDQKGVLELAKELGAVSARAREGKLSGADMQGGTFTISSLGGIGTTAFTPIVNMPEVGILGVSKADTKPKWDGHAFQPRLMLPLSLSLDHRVVDGAEGARFLSFLVRALQDLKEILL